MATTLAGLGLKGAVYQIERALKSWKKHSNCQARVRNSAHKRVVGVARNRMMTKPDDKNRMMR